MKINALEYDKTFSIKIFKFCKKIISLLQDFHPVSFVVGHSSEQSR